MYGEQARDKWKFPLPVGEIRDAVHARLAYHRDRLAYWQAEFTAYEAKLRTEGLKLESYDHSGGRGVSARVDHGISNRLGQASSKIKAHQESIQEYEAFAFGLARKGDGDVIEMTAVDLCWAGFVGAPASDEEEEDE